MSKAVSRKKLDKLQEDTFWYFMKEANPANGLVKDNTRTDAPASIAAVGLALAVYPVGVERKYITRREGVERTLATLGFFHDSPHNTEADATGYKGFYYHFLDIATGRRVWQCELSTIDTAYLLAGALAAAAYFNGDAEGERQVRELAEALYRRADWQWAQNGGLTVSHGWRPETGFLESRWSGYNEALIIYVLGLGAPIYPLPAESYAAWTSTYSWKQIYGHEYLYAGPLFLHQLSHVWIDFRGIQDEFMRKKGIDYFENSRRATYVQREYAIRNPLAYKDYGEYVWGITASDGPGPVDYRLDDIERRFYAYHERGVPYGMDDGTLSPWVVVASLPFAEEIVLPTIEYFDENYPDIVSKYGFKCSLNPTFPTENHSNSGWISKGYYGIDQGPVVLMIENHRSELIWDLMKKHPYMVEGLRRAGFSGGWLDDVPRFSPTFQNHPCPKS